MVHEVWQLQNDSKLSATPHLLDGGEAFSKRLLHIAGVLTPVVHDSPYAGESSYALQIKVRAARHAIVAVGDELRRREFLMGVRCEEDNQDQRKCSLSQIRGGVDCPHHSGIGLALSFSETTSNRLHDIAELLKSAHFLRDEAELLHVMATARYVLLDIAASMKVRR
jgi:hypothetical protein